MKKVLLTLMIVWTMVSLAIAADRDNPRMANKNCDIRGREDDLTCNENGEKIEKATYVVGEMVGLAVLCYFYKMVNNE